MAENKNAKTSADGPVAWGCQCGRAYTVTCISSKPTKQEPVAWLKTWSNGSLSVLKTKSRAFADHELEPLYTAPPKREWVGLTDDAVFELADTNLYDGGKNYGVLAFAKAIEQALKEKNR